MAGIVKLHVQLGDSLTATNNFQLTSAAADGTMKLARGNMGATTQDILTVAASTGVVSVPQGMAALPSVSGSFYEEYTSGTITTTGCCTTATGTVKAVRVGKVVTLNFSTFTGTSTVNTFLGVATGIPASMRPSVLLSIVGSFRMKDNSAFFANPVMAQIDTAGSVVFYKDASGSLFTASGTVGISDPSTITYSVL